MDKYSENEIKINKYTKQIKGIQKKYRIIGYVDNLAITVAIISGIAFLVVSPFATIPLAISLASSYIIHKKQDTYTTKTNDLTVKRGILETENRKSLEKDIEDYFEIENNYQNNSNTTNLLKWHEESEIENTHQKVLTKTKNL